MKLVLLLLLVVGAGCLLASMALLGLVQFLFTAGVLALLAAHDLRD